MSETTARRAAMLRVLAKSLKIGERLQVDVLADFITEGRRIPPGDLIPWVERIGENMPSSPMIAAWLRELQRQLEDPATPKWYDPPDTEAAQ